MGTSSAAPARIDSAQGGRVVRDRVTVEIRPDVPDPRAEIRRIAQHVAGSIEGSVPGTRIFDLRVTDIETMPEVLETVRQDPAVRSAARAWLGSSDFVPNDPVWTAGNADKHWNLDMIHAPDAWDEATGADTLVGVIDVGFATEHPDLAPNIVDVSGGGDDPRHGSHTAGTACAAGDNGIGMTGVAYNCDLILRGIANRSTSASQMAEAMRWVARRGARVVNISYGWNTTFDCTKGSPTEEETAQLRDVLNISSILQRQAAELDDVLWVFSAGNEGLDASCSAGGRLGNFPNVVSVAAVDRDGDLPAYSNFGSMVSIAAPGGAADGGTQVFSAAPVICLLLGTDHCTSDYAYMAGTSMAAPHVTGTAALAFSVNPGLTARQAKDCLTSGAIEGGDAVTGQPFFVVNAKATVDCAEATAPSSPAASVLRTWGRGRGEQPDQTPRLAFQISTR